MSVYGPCPHCRGPRDAVADYPGHWTSLLRCRSLAGEAVGATKACGYDVVFTDLRNGDAVFAIDPQLALQMAELPAAEVERMLDNVPRGPERLPRSIEALERALRHRRPYRGS